MNETGTEPKIKCHFSLTPDALEIIERRAASQNKRGDWISAALQDYDEILAGVGAHIGDCGIQEQLLSRMAALEKRIGMVIMLLSRFELMK